MLFLALVATLCLQSCKKEDASLTSKMFLQESISKYLGIPVEARGGGISIQSTSGFGKNPKGYVVNSSLKKDKIYEHLEIDGISIPAFGPNNFSGFDDRLARIFGKTVTVTLGQDTTRGAQLRDAPTSQTINVPPDLYVSAGGGSGGGGGDGGRGGVIPRTQELTWNGQPSGNVLILICFEPNSAWNDDFSSYPRVMRYLEVRDNGFYRLGESNFADIPTGAVVDVIVVRGSTALIGGSANGQGAASLTAYSSATLVTHIGN